MALSRSQNVRADVLRLPLLGAFLRWKYARFVLQLPLLLIALLAVLDGFTGPQLSGRNVATISVWVHYRGLVAMAAAVFGNLFCAACPLMLTRGPSKFLSKLLLKFLLPKFSWPKILANKYLVIALTLVFLFCYEHFALWASPWLTAWVVLGYFVAALLVDSFFPVGTFCKYVCPLGNFNFAISEVSPSMVSAKNQDVCESCVGKYCLNGRTEFMQDAQVWRGTFRERNTPVLLPMLNISEKKSNQTFPGCETNLFVPSIQSNQDCTLCLNCLRACPHDNVALEIRAPILSALQHTPKTDWAWFTTLLLWGGALNAFAMTPSYFSLAGLLANVFGTRNNALLLLMLLALGIGGGLLLSWLAATISGLRLRNIAAALWPQLLAMWGGHYLYHFVLGANTLPWAIVNLLIRFGLPLHALPLPSIQRLDDTKFSQYAFTVLAFFASVYIAYRRALTQPKNSKDPAAILVVFAPQLILSLVFALITLLLFAQPMQARGSLLPL